MTRKEKKQLEAVEAQIAANKPTRYMIAYLSGLGIQAQDGFAWIGKAQIDLRFENLTPTIEYFK